MISILSTPQLFNPVYNDIVFTVDSDNKALCSFKYVAYVYVNDVEVITLKLFPNATDGTATFRLNKVLENYVSHDRHIGLEGLTTRDPSVLTFSCVFAEESDGTADCSGTAFVIDNELASDTYIAWNAALQYEEFQDYDYNTFMPSRDTTAVGPNEVYNGIFVDANGGWPAFGLDPSNNGFGMYNDGLIFETGTATHTDSVVNTETVLKPTVSYDFSVTYTLVNGGTTTFSITFGSAVVYTGTLSSGTHTITGAGTCDTFGAGAITLTCQQTAVGSCVFDNLVVRESALDSGTWTPRRLLSNHGETGASVVVHPAEEAYISWLQYRTPDNVYLYTNQPSHVMIQTYNGPTATEVYFIPLDTEENIDPTAVDFPTSEKAKFMITAGVGPRNIALYFSTLLFEVTRYEVSLVYRTTTGPAAIDYDYVKMSETVAYTLVRTPTRFVPHRLDWLGRLGNSETYSFRQRDTRTVSSDQQEYTKILPYWDGDRFGYELGDRGRTVFYNSVTEKLTASSEYMTAEEAAWLEELFTTPDLVEHQRDPYFCFSIFERVSGVTKRITLPEGHGVKMPVVPIGDEGLLVRGVIMDLTNGNSYEFSVIGVSGNVVTIRTTYSVTFFGPFEIEFFDNTLGVLPCVVTSRDFKLRDKRGSGRNISYDISYERAYPLTVQRG